MTDLAELLVEQQEGLSLTAYRDTTRTAEHPDGLWTIGYGHLLDQSKDHEGLKWTQFQAETQLNMDMATARAIATRYPFYYQLNDVRQAVLISMSFQLGDKPLYWPHFMDSMYSRDYAGARAAGLDSLWAKQTPDRATLEMSMLASGEWERFA